MSSPSEEIRVLHVDDDAEFTAATADFLEQETDRFAVETATSVGEALDRFDESSIDCVVSGYELPDADGIEFLESVREDYPELPFILLTGEGSEAVASDAISAGVTDYLQKGSVSEQYTVLAHRIANAVSQYRTQRRAAERERELRQFETIVDAIDDAIYVLDGDGRLRYVNDSYSRMKGRDKAELLGTPIDRWADPAVIERTRGMAREVQQGDREIGKLEYEFRTADGEHIPAELRFTTVEFRDGSRGRVGVIRDITERVERERKLRRQNERLDEFAGIVSHDLRNPLNVLEGSLRLAVEGDTESFERCQRAIDRMDRLIDGLLTLAQEGGDIETTEPVVLADLVEECWATVETAGATLTVDTDAVVRADRNRLRQLLENLFRNAVEHASASPDPQAHGDAGEHADGSADITVGDLADGFYVADDGPGVPEEDRDRVFEPGYSTSREGTGLGLSIVGRVAEAHGWDVAVTDSQHGGARFEITGVEFA